MDVMKIIDISNEYFEELSNKWKYMITKHYNISKEILWLKENNIEYGRLGFDWLFTCEEDVIAFKLRWG